MKKHLHTNIVNTNTNEKYSIWAEYRKYWKFCPRCGKKLSTYGMPALNNKNVAISSLVRVCEICFNIEE